MAGAGPRDAGRCVVIVNPNTSTRTTALLEAVANEWLRGSGLHAVGVTVAQGPAIITDPVALRAAVPHVLTAARRAVEAFGPVGIVVGAIGDPGAAELRREAAIPVVGIGEATIAVASAGGRRFGMVTTTAELAESLLDLVARHAPDGRFTGLRLTDTDAETLVEDPAAQLEELSKAAVAACDEDGAEAIIVGGGPLSRTARELVPLVSVPVVEPVPSALECLCSELAARRR